MTDLRQGDFAKAKDGSAKSQGLEAGIDIGRHLAQRKAVKALGRPGALVICSQRFQNGTMTARVLFGRRYYDVDARTLQRLRDGARPVDLGLEPILGDD